ncbi:hypothetical protein STCU_01948 [Strigomonas culicis]|uniref:Uncharacterized protein n=1 Tax=Strigomonas culicis TaxID=28005 RepID=S9UDW1_9TRYP|nr:hypothetical protein STCU_04774 [Strigomonas culicis]EPY33818.1 hypothetical protein STCU_01948 [Strigomonas culicis]|eukprot:EPY29002.1 hypothetical protein STCU_04774 [Strigomonas culicis]
MKSNPEEDKKQEQTLAKLQWLIGRSKLDFKGNPSQFEISKTQKTVEKQRQQRVNAFAAGEEFLPFWHGAAPLALDAVRCDYLKGVDNHKFAQQAELHCNRSRQRVDPESGMEEIRRALTWESAPVRPVTESRDASASAAGEVAHAHPRRRLDAHVINSLPPHERAAAFREDILAHPKHTFQSASGHRSRWQSGTQLGEIMAPPPCAGKNSRKRNAVRVTSLQ